MRLAEGCILGKIMGLVDDCTLCKAKELFPRLTNEYAMDKTLELIKACTVGKAEGLLLGLDVEFLVS